MAGGGHGARDTLYFVSMPGALKAGSGRRDQFRQEISSNPHLRALESVLDEKQHG